MASSLPPSHSLYQAWETLLLAISALGTFTRAMLGQMSVQSLNCNGTGDLIREEIFKTLLFRKWVIRVEADYITIVKLPLPSTTVRNAYIEFVKIVKEYPTIPPPEFKRIFSLIMGLLKRKNGNLNITPVNKKTRSVIKSGIPVVLFGSSKGELDTQQVLVEKGIEYVREKRIGSFDCYNEEEDYEIRNCRLDFVIASSHIIIEFDGQYHERAHRSVSTDSFKAALERDRMKDEWAIKNGFYLIRLSYKTNNSTDKIKNNLESAFQSIQSFPSTTVTTILSK